MLVIPAIDIKDGKCVRLLQGRREEETVFSDNPAAMAQHWEEEGAELLHLVDLDGAFEGTPKNLPIIKMVIESIDIPVELGGGIRTSERIEQILEIGVYRVILGTLALKDPDFVQSVCEKYGERIAVSIDAKDGMVATHGWLEVSQKPAIEFASEMQERGVKTIIYTDIKRDGTLTGPNIEATRELAQAVEIDNLTEIRRNTELATKIEVIASGGISSIDDILTIKSLEPFGVTGAITGQALYTGKLNLREAIKVSKT